MLSQRIQTAFLTEKTMLSQRIQTSLLTEETMLSQRNTKAIKLEIARFQSASPPSLKAKSNAFAIRKGTGYAALPLEK